MLDRELFVVLLILLVFLFLGPCTLGFLGLRPPTLSISGGIVLFLIALGMVFSSRSGLAGEGLDDEPLIVPLAAPLIAGPSSIALLLLIASKNPGGLGSIALAVCGAWFAAALFCGVPRGS